MLNEQYLYVIFLCNIGLQLGFCVKAIYNIKNIYYRKNIIGCLFGLIGWIFALMFLHMFFSMTCGYPVCFEQYFF